jgi:hypothetical protein
LSAVAWTGFAYLLVQAIIKEDRRALLWAGVVAGVALEAKYGMAIWMIALGAGIAVTAARRILTWGTFWFAVLLGSIFAPSLLWQSLHGWPFLAVHAHRRCSQSAQWLGRICCLGLRNTWWIAAAAVSLVLAPIALPLLDPPALARYLEWTHLAPQPEEVAAIGAPLTQIFSDELGWRALEKQVAQVYRSLEPEERAHAAILTTNYGEAAALEVYGRQDGLPPVLCAQNQYFLWGDHGADEKVLIHVNGDPARWRRACQSVEVAGNFGAPYVMPYENNRPIFLCRGLPPDRSPKYGRG